MFHKKNDKQRAALVSLVLACVLTTVKLLVALETDSLGLLSEALHSGLDLLASGITLAAVTLAEKPADDNHPFGHGKAENLAALAQTLLLFATCFWLIGESLERLFGEAHPVAPSLLAQGVLLLSLGIDVNRVRILRRVAREHKSQALEADALHFSTDIWSTSVVLVGSLLIWLGDALALPKHVQDLFALADPAAALVVALLLLVTSLRMATSSVAILMDASSPELRDAVTNAVTKLPGILEVADLRIRQSGAQYFVTMTIRVAAHKRTDAAHSLAHSAEEAALTVIPEADVTVHVEPSAAQMQDPLESLKDLAHTFGLTLHHVHIFGATNPCHIAFHLEVPGELEYTLAHERVERFERALTHAIPNATVTSHLEPEHGRIYAPTRPISPETKEEMLAIVRATLAKESLLEKPQSFVLFDHPEFGTHLSFHCSLTRAMTVTSAHAITTRLEEAIRRALPTIAHITIHLEPSAPTDNDQGAQTQGALPCR